MKVVQCLKLLVGPPPRSGKVSLGSIVKELSSLDLEWMAPLLLAVEKDDVTDVILHLAANVAACPTLRFQLICLHNCGFGAGRFF